MPDSSLVKYDLTVSFLGYWFVGTGRESGAYSDESVLRDSSGFPYVPGKSLKGVFREAFASAAEAGWFDAFNTRGISREEFAKELTGLIFGRPGAKLSTRNTGLGKMEDSTGAETGDDNGGIGTASVADELLTEGLIHFSNGAIPPGVRERITRSGIAGSGGAEHLFTTIKNTAIDKITGTAGDKSLRTMEVVVPLHLHAELSLDAPYPDQEKAMPVRAEDLRQIAGMFGDVAALITEIGGKRRRGFGRCIWKLVPMED